MPPRIGFVGLCAGVGGADSMMLAFLRETSFYSAGIALEQRPSHDQLRVASQILKKNATLHLHPTNSLSHDGFEVKTHHTFLDAASEVYRQSDVIIAWGLNCSDLLDGLPRKPLVLWVQNEDSWAAGVSQRLAPYATLIVAVSQSCRKLAVPEEYRHRTSVIYNAADLTRCTPGMPRSKMRRILGVGEQGKLLLYAGRMVKEKNTHTIALAIDHLPPEWHLLFVGSGSEKNTTLSIAQGTRAGQEGRVKFIAHVSNIGDVLNASDVFILPSDFEGDPVAVHEAAICGVPVVASNLNSIREQEEKLGRLVWTLPEITGKAIADQVQKATPHDPRVRRAREVSWHIFQTARMTRQLEDVLLNAM